MNNMAAKHDNEKCLWIEENVVIHISFFLGQG